MALICPMQIVDGPPAVISSGCMHEIAIEHIAGPPAPKLEGDNASWVLRLMDQNLAEAQLEH
jgi:hypothetical protein